MQEFLAHLHTSDDMQPVGACFGVAWGSGVIHGSFVLVKRQKSVYRLVTAPQGGTQKYTLTFAYYSLRGLVN